MQPRQFFLYASNPQFSNHAHKSRRRACQACVEGKAKCDLRQPCTRCTGKQWACVYDQQRDSISPCANLLQRTTSGAQGSRSSHSPPVAGPSGSVPYVRFEAPESLPQPLDDPDLHLLENIDGFPSSTFREYREYAGVPLPGSSYAGSSYATESLYDAESSAFSGGLGDNQSHSVGPSANLGNSNPGGSFGQLAQSMTSTINTLLSDELIQRHYWNVIEKDSVVASPLSGFPSLQDPSLQVAEFPWATDPMDMQPFMAEMHPLGLDPTETMQAFMGLSAPAGEPLIPSIPNPAIEPAFIPYPSEFQQYSESFYFFYHYMV